MNGLSVSEWWLRAAVFAIVAVWRVHQTVRRPSLASMLISVIFVAIAANMPLEAWAHAESQRVDGRPFIASAIQTLALLVAWCAACAYYAHADGSPLAWRITTVVAVLAVVTAAATIAAGLAVPAGEPLYNFGRTTPISAEVTRYYLLVLSYFPVSLAAGGYLAARTARRSRGPLRVAMAMAAVGQWLLATSSPLLVLRIWAHHSGWNLPGWVVWLWGWAYFAGALIWVASFGAVAAAHRTSQLTSLRRAWRNTRALRHLLHDLEDISPSTLAYPRTGRTPLLMRPHAALLRTRIECRDRLVTISPYLGADLPEGSRQQPVAVAEAIARIRHHDTIPDTPPRAPSVAILTVEGTDRDLLAELADCYTRINHR